MAKSRKSSRSRKSQPRIRRIPKISQEAVAITLLVVAAATLVSLLFPAALTSDWRNTVLDWFGASGFALPVLIGAFGLGLLWSKVDKEYKLRASEITGWFLAFLFLLSFGHLAGQMADPHNRIMGLAGEALFDMLSFGLGSIGSTLAILTLGIAGVLLALSIGPIDLWLGLAQLWRAASEYVEERLFPRFKVNRPPTYHEPVILKIPSVLKSNGRAAAAPRPPTEPAKTPVKTPVKAEQVKPPRPVTARDWQLPPISLLTQATGGGELSQAEIRQKVKVLEETLSDFDVQAHVVEVNPGPTVTQFGLEPGFHERFDRHGSLVKREKVKVSEITTLANDLALALAAPSIRIEAPVPGRAVVGIEVPNAISGLVSLRGVIETPAFQKIKAKSKLAIGLGQTVSGQPIAADLAKMPHLLIAGATGAGKSVCINSIIASLLLHCTPDDLRLLMIDPKRVELTGYNDIPHLLAPVVVDVDRAVGVLKRMLTEMNDRYKKFEQAGMRDIERYNKQLGRDKRDGLPYIVVVIDELAELMMLASEEIEQTLCILAQKARATGIHLVVATQRPSVDVVTGLIKANIPTRISFAVASQVDSRTILDMVGAEKLLGKGDMLFLPTDAPKPHRLQGTYVSDEEIEEIVGYWKTQSRANYVEEFANATAENTSEEAGDPLYQKAIELAQQHTTISTSFIQRRLGIGYPRAARLVDMMEAAEIIGPSEGGKSREVLISQVRSALPLEAPGDARNTPEDNEPA